MHLFEIYNSRSWYSVYPLYHSSPPHQYCHWNHMAIFLMWVLIFYRLKNLKKTVASTNTFRQILYLEFQIHRRLFFCVFDRNCLTVDCRSDVWNAWNEGSKSGYLFFRYFSTVNDYCSGEMMCSCADGLMCWFENGRWNTFIILLSSFPILPIKYYLLHFNSSYHFTFTGRTSQWFYIKTYLF